MSIAYENYLETGVLTASPQKLQLLLIEAAIRSIHRGKEASSRGDEAAASEHFIHAQDCVGQMLAGLNYNGAAEIVKRLAAVYVFILRQLAEGSLNRDTAKLDDAVRVLEVERETWRQVCEQFGSETAGNNPPTIDRAQSQPQSNGSTRIDSSQGELAPADASDFSPRGGFCLDA